MKKILSFLFICTFILGYSQQKELTLERETMMVEDLIDELVSKRNKTQRDKDNLDLLRIKLRQLREN